jgi:hypothetical protein
MPRSTSSTLALALTLGSLATTLGGARLAAETPRVELEARLWDPDPSGRIQVLAEGFGTEIDLAGDLGLSGDPVVDLRLTFHPTRRMVVRLAAVPLDYTGDSVVSRTITFAGQDFTVSSRVTSHVTLDYARVGFAWQFLSSSDGRFRVGPMVEAKGFRGDASLGGPDLNPPVSVSESFEAAFGSAGLLLDLEASDRVSVFGEWSTVVAADQGSESDFEIGARVRLWNALHAVGGIRSIQIRFEDGNDLIDVDMDGAFFGVSLRY